MKKIALIVVVISAIALLYINEYNKISRGGNLPTLDSLKSDSTALIWNPFYRVRATIVDGETIKLSAPDELKKLEGSKIDLVGAAEFANPNINIGEDLISIRSFNILPSIGLVEACDILPEVKMRWTIRVSLIDPWILNRDDLIGTEVQVQGDFRIDCSDPFDAIFFLDSATAKLIN